MTGRAGPGGRERGESAQEAQPVGEHVGRDGRDNGLPRRYLRACLLLLVAEGPAHGYELVGRLRGLGLPKPDAGTVYRTLRSLDGDGLVRSWWSSSVAGPARRLYATTPAGMRCLTHLSAGLEQDHEHLSTYLRRQRSLEAPGRTDGRPLPALARR